MAVNRFKIALVQMRVSATKRDNISKAVKIIKEAKREGADLIVLPECFNSPYGTKYFAEYAEEVPLGETSAALSAAAKDNDVTIIGGSIPEKENSQLYNTCAVWSRTGGLLAVHRKVHLFDIDIPGKIRFMESEVLAAGEKPTVFNFNNICKIGLGICYDLRFPEMAMLYRDEGADLVVYPGAFNMTTGPLHWELLLRARAVDHQMYVAGVCGARDESADYIAWGHSTLVDPWGKMPIKADHEEGVFYADIDLNLCKEIREQIPVGKQRRTDLYETVKKCSLSKL